VTARFVVSLVLFTPALCSAIEPAPARADKDLPSRQRVREAKSYYCYYGPDRAAELSRYDVVILHTPAATPEVVKQLKDAGVVTIGYITCGEDLPPARKGDGTGPGGFASWYFDKDGDNQPDAHPIWKAPFANAADPKWRADRVAEAKRLVEEVGFDGIFLDTVDDVTIYPETFDGMAQLIHDFRRALPAAPIVMNQSWELMRKVAPAIDGVMLEGFSTSYDFENKRHRRNPPSWDDDGLSRVKKYIVPLREQHPLQVFVLDYADPSATEMIQLAKDRAATFGFLHCVAPMRLDEIYTVNAVGKADPKWWEKQATPATLSITLDASRNGFPAGTKIVPSSCFGGYTVAPVVDGIADRESLDWSRAAWASAEDGEPQWIEIHFPEPRSRGRLRIDWQSGHASRTFGVQTKASDDGTWADVMRVRDNRDASNFVSLPANPLTVIRIVQEPGGGSVERPNLMWVAQVSISEDK
jgi:hypothetical protein